MATAPATATQIAFTELERRQVLNAYKQLMRDSLDFTDKASRKLIRQAFNYALDAHGDVRRKSGEPYILHPIAVARIVVREVGLQDVNSIVCALLHDVVEDTYVKLEDIEGRFGKTAARIVDGLTKISGVFDPGSSKQAENFRKMLLTMSDDVRVALIKIADRLHNMRTIGAMRAESQLKIAAETQYLYAPLAHRLGLYAIKSELEDLALSITEPDIYRDIMAKLRDTKTQRNRYIQSFIEPIDVQMQNMGLLCSIRGRVKSISSIYQKMRRQGVPIEQVYDVFAIRIVIDAEPEDEKWACWRAFSAITSTYRPHPDRTRDWISIPRPTGYESLHVTVMGPKGRWVEVQIRSSRMDMVAERGPAAHWKYKDNPKAFDQNLDRWLGRIRELLESQQLTSLDMVSAFKTNLVSEEIFVFTPKGELKTLPMGATALDLGYEVHSSIGTNCIGAKVNGRVVPLSHELHNGDQVEIITARKQEPKPEWLDFVKTHKARVAIKERLKKIRKGLMARGKDIYDWKMQGLGFREGHPKMREFMAYFRIPDLEELYYRLGSHQIDAKEIQQFIDRHAPFVLNPLPQPTESQRFDAFVQQTLGVNPDELVLGEAETADVQLATCCSPIPGDSVIGLVDPIKGVVVHRTNCPKATEILSSYGTRVIKAKWGSKQELEFLTAVHIVGQDRTGMLNDIIKAISVFLKMDVRSFTIDTEDGMFEATVRLYTHGLDEMEKLLAQLQKIAGVFRAERLEN